MRYKTYWCKSRRQIWNLTKNIKKIGKEYKKKYIIIINNKDIHFSYKNIILRKKYWGKMQKPNSSEPLSFLIGTWFMQNKIGGGGKKTNSSEKCYSLIRLSHCITVKHNEIFTLLNINPTKHFPYLLFFSCLISSWLQRTSSIIQISLKLADITSHSHPTKKLLQCNAARVKKTTWSQFTAEPNIMTLVHLIISYLK